MRALQRPGRAIAVVGALVAAGATTLMAISAGTASATVPGRCLENVNVRAEPDIDSRIVALCEAGTAVTVGESRNGFVHLTNLGGWSAERYIEANGQPASARTTEPVAGATSAGGQDDELRAPHSSGTGPAAGAPANRSTPAGPRMPQVEPERTGSPLEALLG